MPQLPFVAFAAVAQAASAVWYTLYAPQDASVVRTASYSFLCAAICHVIYRHIIWPRALSPLRHLPHPEFPKRGGLLLGHAPYLARRSRPGVLRHWAKTIPNSGLLWYYSMNKDVVIVTESDGIREALIDRYGDYSKSEQQARLLEPTIGKGLILADGAEHKRQRRLLGPSFKTSQMVQYTKVFWKYATELVGALESHVKQDASRGDGKTAVVEVGEWSHRVSLDIIGAAGMGRSFESLHDETAPMASAYAKIIQVRDKARPLMIFIRMMFPFDVLRALKIDSQTTIRDAIEYIKNQARMIINEARREMGSGTASDSSSNILSGMLHDRTAEGIEMEDMVEQTLTLLTAGHKTVSSALTWAFWAIAKAPEIQEKMRKELARAQIPLAEPGSQPPTPADLEGCQYLQAVVNEVLRVYPSVPMFLRTAAQDTIISGTVVPKGTTVMLAPWVANVSKKTWGEDAEVFDPDRWIDGRADMKKQGIAAMTTFGLGKSNCIGQGFARLELAVLLAAVVSRFSLELEDPELEPEPWHGATANPRQAVNVKMSIC